jgi:hypothetical protein
MYHNTIKVFVQVIFFTKAFNFKKMLYWYKKLHFCSFFSIIRLVLR